MISSFSLPNKYDSPLCSLIHISQMNLPIRSLLPHGTSSTPAASWSPPYNVLRSSTSSTQNPASRKLASHRGKFRSLRLSACEPDELEWIKPNQPTQGKRPMYFLTSSTFLMHTLLSELGENGFLALCLLLGGGPL